MAKMKKLISLSSLRDKLENQENSDLPKNNIEKTSKKEPYGKILTTEEFYNLDLEAPTWLIEDHLTEGLTILSGDPKISKSTFIVGLAIDISLGKKVLGKLESNPSSVLFVAFEEPPHLFRTEKLDPGFK